MKDAPIESATKLTGSPAAHAAHRQIKQVGGLKLTVGAGQVPTARFRRTPAMPKVSMADSKPTPEREAKAPEGINRASGSGAHRVRCPLEVFWNHLGAENVAAANRWLRLISVVEEAQRSTPTYSGMPIHAASPGACAGGVKDDQHSAIAELAYIEAKLEPELAAMLEILKRHDDNARGRPRTVADLGRQFCAYEGKENALPAGVGLMRAALVRLRSLQAEIRTNADSALTRQGIVAGQRKLKATTAQEQFRREQARDGQ